METIKRVAYPESHKYKLIVCRYPDLKVDMHSLLPLDVTFYLGKDKGLFYDYVHKKSTSLNFNPHYKFKIGYSYLIIPYSYDYDFSLSRFSSFFTRRAKSILEDTGETIASDLVSHWLLSSYESEAFSLHPKDLFENYNDFVKPKTEDHFKFDFLDDEQLIKLKTLDYNFEYRNIGIY